MKQFFNLQLFAEGAAGSGAGDAAAAGVQGVTGTDAVSQVPDGRLSKGVKNNPLASVKYGIQDGGDPSDGDASDAGKQSGQGLAGTDRSAAFEALIKGEYKDLYDARVQDTIQKRLKGTKETVERYNTLLPTIEMLAKKYGVNADDVQGLNKAIEEDDAYYEDEALEKGVSVQQLKEIRKMERENALLRQQMQERQTQEKADRLYAAWMEQSEAVKGVYPSFDLRAEMNNPRFVDLLRSNIDVRTAYEVLHKDEIIPAAMQFTAKAVEQKLTNKLMQGGARPVENGSSGQSAAVVKNDVTQLTKADRAEIIRRVQRGEKIRF